MSTETQQQECPGLAKPQAEHEWLQQLVGEWTFESECIMGPDQPPMKSSGSERVRSIGGMWTIGEGECGMPGAAEDAPSVMTTVMTLGYDPAQTAFIGTFIATGMTHMWLYRGELDAARKTLTLSAEGPSFAGDGTMANYRDVIEFKSPDHRTLTSHMQTPDGQWVQFMTAHYHRAK